ncbi:MAG: NAD(P)-dependent oxidoreductase [Hyphomicrobiales bacterium]|nr:MAG: NAD(P)-dependent oxidoreductase [Hyphomicrobiales bacterium]
MSDVIVITGGSRGIGAACAIGLADPSRTIIVNYVGNQFAADEVVEAVIEKGGSAVAVQGDVGEEADILRMFEVADAQGSLVGLINNAGIVDEAARVDEFSAERISKMLNVNVLGSILCAREAVKRMSTKHGGKGGAIVNLSSVAALLGAPNNYVDYAASKGAIDSFTKGLALEVAAEDIRVNAVRPGIIATDIHASGGQPDRVAEVRASLPMQREGSAEEVANSIIWLMSKEASYVTGAILDVSGGR